VNISHDFKAREKRQQRIQGGRKDDKEVFRGELLTKRVKMSLFILLKQDVGLPKIMRERVECLYKKEAYLT